MRKKYRDNVTLDKMILDGWCRGFSIEQSLEEIHAQGYLKIREDDIPCAWANLDEDYEDYCAEQESSAEEIKKVS
jgi:hypothetical protein